MNNITGQIKSSKLSKIKDELQGKIHTNFESTSNNIPHYNGAYELTPSNEQQTLATAGKVMDEDLVINSMPYDSDTTDATAIASEILSGKTAYAKKQKITGTMINRQAVNGEISSKSSAYTIPEGYHNGNGNVVINNAEQAKIIPENIKDGVSILGVTGTYLGQNTSDATAQASEILESKSAYVQGEKILGSMPNRGAVRGIISSLSEGYQVQEGYHNGAGTVLISSVEQAKLIPENIKNNVVILGIRGSYEAENISTYQNDKGGDTFAISSNDSVIDLTQGRAYNKVVFNNTSIIDLTNDTVTAENLLQGCTAHAADGSVITGTLEIGDGSSFISPYVFDLHTGYLTGGGIWRYNADEKYSADVYQLTLGHKYFLTLGESVGSQFIAVLINEDVSQVTTSATGTLISTNGSEAYSNVIFQNDQNLYLVVYKDNKTKHDIKTYLIDMSEQWL